MSRRDRVCFSAYNLQQTIHDEFDFDGVCTTGKCGHHSRPIHSECSPAFLGPNCHLYSQCCPTGILYWHVSCQCSLCHITPNRSEKEYIAIIISTLGGFYTARQKTRLIDLSWTNNQHLHGQTIPSPVSLFARCCRRKRTHQLNRLPRLVGLKFHAQWPLQWHTRHVPGES